MVYMYTRNMPIYVQDTNVKKISKITSIKYTLRRFVWPRTQIGKHNVFPLWDW